MSDKKAYKTSIGGQALIEGVMMRGPEKIAMSVRKPDGDIITETKDVSSIVQKYKLTKVPIVRGIFAFFDSMVTGTKALMFSANYYADIEGGEEYKPSKFEIWLDEKLGDKITDVVIYFSVIVALIFSVGLFILLPTFLVGLVKDYVAPNNNVLANLIEGAVRITIFIIYLSLVSMSKDIRRVFEYHGAEHKTIACYENGDELIPENVKKYSRLHPRCGTSFLLIVMIVSIILFSFTSWPDILTRIVIRISLMPFVAGISFEIIKFAGRCDNIVVQFLNKPGIALQNLTTREPDESQIEVAIASLKAVIPSQKGEDKW